MEAINNIQQELDDAREQQRLNIPAKRILEKIQGIPSDIEKLQRRWFWELLQNASDYNDEVEVVLELYPNKIIFKHNGKPFRPIDTENLIAPDSGKDDHDTRTNDMIGQFGTGFISTHVLSSHITVNGIIKSEHTDNYHKFDFTLDRSGFTNKESLKKAITVSSNELNASVKITTYTPGIFDTTFTYQLEKNLPGVNSGQAVTPGLEYVYDVLPYTLAFMPKIKKVTINNFSTQFVNYSERSFAPIASGCLGDFNVLIKTIAHVGASTKEENRVFHTLTIDDASVIVQTENKIVLPYPEKLTKLFCALPMIGTEDFASPIAINSSKFVPKNERDGIKLSVNNQLNKTIVSSASQAYITLINRLILLNFDGFFNIVKWTYYSGEESEKKWFSENVINPIKSHLLNAKIVRTNSSRITLDQTKIPYFTSEELKKNQHDVFYQLCFDFMPQSVPIKKDFSAWFANIDFNVFKNCKYELKEFLAAVDELGNTTALEEKVESCKPWLIRLIRMTLIIDENLLDQYKIIPNQLGEFVFRKDNLFYDDNLDTALIEIHDIIKEASYHKILLDKEFEVITDLLGPNRTKIEVDLAKAIDDIFSEIPESERSSTKFQNGLKLMFKWFANCGKVERDLKELFKWFSNKKPQLFLETIPNYDRDKVLSIAQSGKLTSLSKLAESNISSEDLDTITSNVEDVVQLAKVLKNVKGGMDLLLQYAEQIKQDDEDFKFKKEIGEKVEVVFKQALLSSGINSNFHKLEHDGIGSHDFEIENLQNGKKFFIELKSYKVNSSESLKLAPSQAKHGSEHPENYCLSTIERPNLINLVTEDYIKSNLISKNDIGSMVAQGLEDYENINKIKLNNKLHLTFRDAIRVNINISEIQLNGMDFPQLISIIKNYLK